MLKSITTLFLFVAVLSSGCATYKTKNFDGIEPQARGWEEALSAPKASEKTGAIPVQATIPKGENETSPAPAPDKIEGGPDASQAPSVGPATGADKVFMFERVIYVDRPVYYPVDQAPPKSGADAVAAANASSQVLPQDYNGRIMWYDYDDTLTYHIYCQPLRLTDIYLEAGETIIDQPYMGDSSRWIVGYGKSKLGNDEVQHIYLKPTMAGLETTLTINTSKRIYYVLIKSFDAVYMAGVRWRYPATQLPQVFVTPASDGKAGVVSKGLGRLAIDPSLVSTDYMMKYPSKDTPAWLPTMVLDDGRKTYIFLPDNVTYQELPALFMEKGELINYRVEGNVFVVDRLIKTLYLKLRNVTVTIEKKEKLR